MTRSGGRKIVGFVIGAILGYGLAIGYYIGWTMIGGVDREGGFAMAIAFLVGPALALVLGLFGIRFASRIRG